MAPAFAISRTVALVHFNRTGKPDLFVYFVSFVVVISRILMRALPVAACAVNFVSRSCITIDGFTARFGVRSGNTSVCSTKHAELGCSVAGGTIVALISPESPISRRRTKRRGLTALNVLVIVALAVGSGVTIPSVKDRKEDFTVVQRGFQPVLSGDSEEPVKVQNAPARHR